jgi:hypothetical protein
MLESSFAAETPPETLAPIARLPMLQVVDIVSQCSGVSVASIMSACRDRQCARARQVAMVLCYAPGDERRSLSTVGRFFDRDHTTVIHALQNFRAPKEEVSALYRRCLHYAERTVELEHDYSMADSIGRFVRALDRRFVLGHRTFTAAKTVKQVTNWRSKFKSELKSCEQVGIFCGRMGGAQ